MGRLIPRAVAALGVGFPPALLSRIGLRALPEPPAATTGGGRRRPRITHLAPVAHPVFDARRNPVDEEAALLLCGAL